MEKEDRAGSESWNYKYTIFYVYKITLYILYDWINIIKIYINH